MSRLSKKSKAEVTDLLIGDLDSIISDEKTPLRDKIKAIELIGREYGLFTERKQINVDIQSIVHQLTDRQLEALSEVGPGAPVIDILPGVDLGSGAGASSGGPSQLGSGEGDPGAGPADEPGLDQTELGEN